MHSNKPIKKIALRSRIGDWIYYTTSFTFEEVNVYVKKVDSELYKSEHLRDMLQRSLTDNYKSIVSVKY